MLVIFGLFVCDSVIFPHGNLSASSWSPEGRCVHVEIKTGKEFSLNEKCFSSEAYNKLSKTRQQDAAVKPVVPQAATENKCACRSTCG